MEPLTGYLSDHKLKRPDALEGMCWYDLAQLPIEGKGWKDTESRYDRLPARARDMVRKPVWDLSRHSAGLCFRFVSDSTLFRARWSLLNGDMVMSHMPGTGCSGLDLYVQTPEQNWRWLGVGVPDKFPDSSGELVAGIQPGVRQFTIYLPLYNGVTSVQLGLPESASIAPAPPRTAGQKPIAFYGTSITQGGCASRPGMAHPAILGRWLDHEVINLGFSGSAKMEPEVAALLAELDPGLYVLDSLPNMTADELNERAEDFIRTLRRSHAETPILLVEDRTYAGAFLIPDQARRNKESRAALRQIYDKLNASGVSNLHYLHGDLLLGSDGEDTVDGSHPTDLGFLRHARTMRPIISQILT